MTIALRQSIASSTSPNFSAATAAGSLLVCVVYGNLSGSTDGALVFSAPTTSGFTWTLGKTNQFDWLNGSSYIRAGVAVYYIANASSMASTTTTSVTVTSSGGTPSHSFNLYEFTGAATSSPVDTSSSAENGVDTLLSVNPGSLTTTTTDLIFVSANTTFTTGTGFTSGVTTADQYILNKASGTVATAFGQSSVNWACAAIAFKTGSISASASPSGVTVASAVGTVTALQIEFASPSGVTIASAVGTASAVQGEFVNPSGDALISAVGTVTIFSQDFASPSGVALTSAVGTVTAFTIDYASPNGVTIASAVGTITTTATSNISVSGLSLIAAVGLIASIGNAFALPAGVTVASAVGVTVGGGATVSVHPTGVAMVIETGSVAAGVPINYGSVVAGSSALPSGINSTYFYARWTGWLMIGGGGGFGIGSGGGFHGGSSGDKPGRYTLGLNVSDGGDFYFGSQFIVNVLSANQTANSTATYTQSQTVELAMNIAYPIVVEWQHGAGANYECQLLWTPPNTTTPVVIPTANLSLTGKWWNGTSAEWYPTTWY